MSPPPDDAVSGKTLVGLGLAGVVLLAANFFVAVWLMPDSPGQFGDIFGLANAFFSGLALVGVVVAIFMQRRELALQRAELEMQRQEMQGQKEALEAQHQAMRLQTQETAFYSLLKYQRELVNSTFAKIDGKALIGAQAYHEAAGRLETLGTRFFKKDELPDAGAEFHSESSSVLGKHFSPYFYALQELLRFTDDAPESVRSRYLDLVRAQLTPSERTILFCHVAQGRLPQMKPWVEKYALLSKWMVPAGLEPLKPHFERSAFEA